jgi:hypothetical protein
MVIGMLGREVGFIHIWAISLIKWNCACKVSDAEGKVAGYPCSSYTCDGRAVRLCLCLTMATRSTPEVMKFKRLIVTSN